MQFLSILFAAVFIAVTATGCAFLTPERVAAIHRTAATALQLAYETGGKALLETKINELVAAGQVTSEQGELLKAAAQNGYAAFLAKLNELAEKPE